MSGSYRTKHHRNKAPRYMRWIPRQLQDLFLGVTQRTKQFKPMSAKVAERVIRRQSWQDDLLFEALERLTPEQRAGIIAKGGVEAVSDRIKFLESEVAEHAPGDFILEQAMNPDLTQVLIDVTGVNDRSAIPQLTESVMRDGMLEMLKRQRAEATELATLRPITLTPEPTG
jgi:hypothetical protein